MERRCLIIDPSTMVRRVAARIIRELGLETLEAKTGQEALDLCSDRMPDAIMLDWSLSDRQAGQFLQELAEIVRRQNVARPTILFCSGERQVSRIVRDNPRACANVALHRDEASICRVTQDD